LQADYRCGDLSVRVQYVLRGHFAEKQMTVTSPHDYGLKKLTVSQPQFSAAGLKIMAYRYPGKTKACCTFFGRTPQGGFFAGTEMPFDASAHSGNTLILAYSPSLKVKAREELRSEPAYFGVYRKRAGEADAQNLPLQSESDAMVAMTSAILGPPRFGLVPLCNGWCSEMEMNTFTKQSVAADMKSLDVIAQCGIDWSSESHPWSGETQQMNNLGPNDEYRPGPLVREFLQHAHEIGVKVVPFTTLNNSNPWWTSQSGAVPGRPFRADRPDWLIDAGVSLPADALKPQGNCLGSQAFWDWLERTTLEAVGNSGYPGWSLDGDFFGGGGKVSPARCQSDKHDHLPGDSNYACQRGLAQLMASLRRRFPHIFIHVYRPPMDLGVWALKNVDACFTLNENNYIMDNLVGGDNIRTWSRTRVQREFLPHYIDQPLLFPIPLLFPKPGNGKGWPKGHLDYILLSALSCSPNQLFYLPTKSGLPDEDKAEIRKWLDWGRKNVEYLQVRKDLPAWPMAKADERTPMQAGATPPSVDRVDGSAHIVGRRGFVFLFNSTAKSLPGEFALTEESIGLSDVGDSRISQHYPAAQRTVSVRHGQTVRWDVPGKSAVILELSPAP
jgi:hypothetical protein